MTRQLAKNRRAWIENIIHALLFNASKKSSFTLAIEASLEFFPVLKWGVLPD
jgi:hypothetical protein